MSRAKDFMDIMNGKKISVIERVNSGLHKEIEINRLKLKPIISTIKFCGTHDLPLRGKKSDSCIFHNILNFRIESGDEISKDHFLTNVGNAKYSSHRTQNKLITLCGKILKEEIVCEANAANAFSIIADESADISGVEQLTIVIRFLDKQSKIREEFLGFLPLDKLDAESVATKILSFLEDSGLNLSKLCGRGYDGCATMAGKVSGVAKLICDRYNKALYFHCASHRLNLVINDLNKIMVIRNTISTIKEIIEFYCESTIRRNLIPNIPLFCETRRSSKYKSIRLFSENVIVIIQSLQSPSINGLINSNTRQRALYLYSSTSNFSFIISMKIITKYSAILEPVTNILQGVSMELYKVREHVEELLKMLEDNRTNANEIFDLLFTNAKSIADDFEITITCPRCIKERFEKSNSVAFSLQHLHPALFIKMKKQEYTDSITNIYNFYKIENLLAESESWYSVWQKKDCQSMDIMDLLEHSKIFFPSITIALEIFLSLPATSCAAERSFSEGLKLGFDLRQKRPDILDIFVVNIPNNISHPIKNLLDPCSDHSPIHLTLDAQPLPQPRPTCLTEGIMNWAKFRDNLDQNIDLKTSLKSPENIEIATQKLTNLIQSAAWNSSIKKTPKKHSNPFSIPAFTGELIAQKRRARALWQLSRLPSDKNIYNNLSSSLKRNLNQLKNESFNSWVSSISAKDGSFWNATRQCLKQKPKCFPLKKPDGTWFKSDDEKADVFRSHLEHVFQLHHDINDQLFTEHISK
ncbi:hypothetical protein QTP88_025494 [Uroleucon formosanum]